VSQNSVPILVQFRSAASSTDILCLSVSNLFRYQSDLNTSLCYEIDFPGIGQCYLVMQNSYTGLFRNQDLTSYSEYECIFVFLVTFYCAVEYELNTVLPHV